MKRLLPLLILLVFCSFSLSCGYTTGSLLPARLKTIYVEEFKNKIAYTTTSVRNVYFPLMEIKVRDAVVDRFMFTGHLKIAKEEDADLILKADLVSYSRDALRYLDNGDVEEYRVQVIVRLTMMDVENNTVYWKEDGFAGESTYFEVGGSASTEVDAVDEAIEDLAERIIERTIENW